MRALNILALNSGSSSLKFGFYRVDSAGAEPLLAETVATADEPDAMNRVASVLAASGLPPPDAIGHRIVHGGPALRQHCRIDAAVLRQLQAAAAFAPLHTPAALALIRFTQQHFPGVPQVACFDTHFHAGLPDVARVLPIARELQSEGIQRYGFHGLSLESIVRQLGDDALHRSSASAGVAAAAARRGVGYRPESAVSGPAPYPVCQPVPDAPAPGRRPRQKTAHDRSHASDRSVPLC